MDYLQRIAKTGRIDLKHDWDNFYCLSGDEGCGKSTLGQKFGRLLDDNFDLGHIVYRYQDFKRKVYKLPPYSAILHDEMGISGFSRDSMKEFNKKLVQMAMVCRDQNKSLISCIPNFWWLDRYLRDHRTRYWFHVETGEVRGIRTRGWAQIRKKPVNSSMWGNTPYWPLVHRYRFTKMPDHIYQAYKDHKRRCIAELDAEEEAESGNTEAMALMKVLRNCESLGYDGKTSAAIIGKHPSTVSRMKKTPEYARLVA